MLNINKKYLDPYGTWMVTTEGDCEGKTTRTLGVFTGRIDEIAFALASKVYYKLYFQKLDTSIPIPVKMENEVNVTLHWDSGAIDLSSDELVGIFDEILKNTDTCVGESREYNAVMLSRVSIQEKKQSDMRKAALAKLTPEERVLLGL